MFGYRHVCFALFVLLVVLMIPPAAAAAAAVVPETPTAVNDRLRERELVFHNGSTRLTGSLILPAGEGPFPAAVLLHGSGPDSRAPYRPDAYTMAEAGIAAFIYDKRGTGSSAGDWSRASLEDLITDGLAAVHLVQAQPEIVAAEVGLWGVSQGGWLAPFAAAQDDQVAFIVQVTSAATPLANQDMWDSGNELARLGFDESAIAMAMKGHQLLFSGRDLIRRGILPVGDLWFVYYDPTLDPAAAWPDIDVPALILFGGRDNLVPTATSRQILEPLLESQGNEMSQIHVFEDSGHALGGPARNEKVAYSGLMTSWILAVTGRGNLPAAAASDDEASVARSTGRRWYGPAAAPTPWYGTAAMQLTFLLCFAAFFRRDPATLLLANDPQWRSARPNCLSLDGRRQLTLAGWARCGAKLLTQRGGGGIFSSGSA